MPKADAPPAVPVPAPADDAKPAALPLKVAGKLAYPAYGERLNGPALPADDHIIVVKSDPAKKPTP